MTFHEDLLDDLLVTAALGHRRLHLHFHHLLRFIVQVVPIARALLGHGEIWKIARHLNI